MEVQKNINFNEDREKGERWVKNNLRREITKLKEKHIYDSCLSIEEILSGDNKNYKDVFFYLGIIKGAIE